MFAYDKTITGHFMPTIRGNRLLISAVFAQIASFQILLFSYESLLNDDTFFIFDLDSVFSRCRNACSM